ncbi:hypothetical protein EJ06DRAFT_582713 [Trichodelitschia bisporula]|uniref:ABM domain-containing protein n=1 Tax=Trichodelitschia bisporula TaxID=703511 RepID=A0A6G1HTN2_9PEZI|nr:hypothetical protein EJ06DRAFT_582713 [Trichodelitschia bisporula]
MGFYLFAQCNFVAGRYADWQAAYDELAVHVFNEEHTTETYYFGIPFEYKDDMDATISMFAFEVYGKREDLYETHFNSAAMQGFLKKIPSTMSTGLDLMHYSLSGGFIDKPGDKTECELMQDIRILSASPSARSAILSRFNTVLAAAEAGSPDVLTLMSFASLDDDVSARIYARFKTRAAYEAFQRRPDFVDFWMASKEDVKQMESHAYVPNGKGWLHR